MSTGNNVTDLFGETEDPKHPETLYHMVVKRKEAPLEEIIGYPVVNSLFAAVCRDGGVIYWLAPFESLEVMYNKGPVSSTVN